MSETCWKCETNEGVFKVRSLEYSQGETAELVPACEACTHKCEECGERFFNTELSEPADNCEVCEAAYWGHEGHLREVAARWGANAEQ